MHSALDVLLYFSEVTMANPVESTSQSAISGSSLYLSAFGAPGGGGSGFDTLDFSMPSYGDSVRGPTKDPPSFSNPFGDIKIPSLSTEEATSADSKKDSPDAFIEAKKAEQKAEQKAAEDKKAADAEAAAQKKAEKEARRQAELEKQRAAVERAREAKEAAPVSSVV
jgi:hypothetical protein